MSQYLWSNTLLWVCKRLSSIASCPSANQSEEVDAHPHILLRIFGVPVWRQKLNEPACHPHVRTPGYFQSPLHRLRITGGPDLFRIRCILLTTAVAILCPGKPLSRGTVRERAVGQDAQSSSTWSAAILIGVGTFSILHNGRVQ